MPGKESGRFPGLNDFAPDLEQRRIQTQIRGGTEGGGAETISGSSRGGRDYIRGRGRGGRLYQGAGGGQVIFEGGLVSPLAPLGSTTDLERPVISIRFSLCMKDDFQKNN